MELVKKVTQVVLDEQEALEIANDLQQLNNVNATSSMFLEGLGIEFEEKTDEEELSNEAEEETTTQEFNPAQ